MHIGSPICVATVIIDYNVLLQNVISPGMGMMYDIKHLGTACHVILHSPHRGSLRS